jgi:4-aminobutyrate aminotransferase
MKMKSSVLEGDVNQGDIREEWYDELPPATTALLSEDSSWFIHQALSTPCLEVVSDCEGPYLILPDGRKILDFHGNNLHQVGYKNKHVLQAVIRQLQTLPFSPRRFTNDPAVRLAEKLTSLVPGLDRVLFAPGGAEVNSIALKLARIITGKHKVVSMWGSFHGSGLDTSSVGGDSAFRKNMDGLLPGVIHVPPPSSYRPSWDNDPDQERYVEYIRYVFEQEGDIGALIAETIRNTDVEIPVPKFWTAIRKLCDEYGVLLILDEIPIALGRTGKLFAFEHYGIVPDMVTIGKGLGGATFPMAAIITRNEFNTVSEYSIGHFTHEKSPVGSAAGLSVLEFIENEKLCEKAAKMGEKAMERLRNMKNRFEIIGDIRGVGLLLGIELVLDRKTKTRAAEESEKIMYRCLSNGLNFKVAKGNVITLAPSLIISDNQMDNALDILEEAIEKVSPAK